MTTPLHTHDFAELEAEVRSQQAQGMDYALSNAQALALLAEIDRLRRMTVVVERVLIKLGETSDDEGPTAADLVCAVTEIERAVLAPQAGSGASRAVSRSRHEGRGQEARAVRHDRWGAEISQIQSKEDVMIQLRFEGHSDDTFGEYALTKTDHDNCADGTPFVCRVQTPAGEGLHVWGWYGGKDWPAAMPACWMVGVQQIDEDKPMPAWPMRFGVSDSGYSTTLTIAAPDDVTLTWLPKGHRR